MSNGNGSGASPQQIERQITEIRAQISDTLDAVQEKLSPGQILDQALGYVKEEGGEFASNFGRSLRDNPLPVALVSVGLAWLMVAGRRSEAGPPFHGEAYDSEAYETAEYYPERDDAESAGRYIGTAGRIGETASRAGDRLKDYSSEAADSLRSGAETARHGVERLTGTARQGYDRAAERARMIRQRTRQASRRAGEKAEQLAGQVTDLKETAEEKAAAMRQQAQAALERARFEARHAREAAGQFARENPLAIAAGALLAGAAVAAFLPRTRRETELMGEKSSELQQSVKEIATEEARKATEIAASVTEKAIDEAKQSLDSGRRTDGSGTAGEDRPSYSQAAGSGGDSGQTSWDSRQPSPGQGSA